MHKEGLEETHASQVSQLTTALRETEELVKALRSSSRHLEERVADAEAQIKYQNERSTVSVDTGSSINGDVANTESQTKAQLLATTRELEAVKKNFIEMEADNTSINRNSKLLLLLYTCFTYHRLCL